MESCMETGTWGSVANSETVSLEKEKRIYKQTHRKKHYVEMHTEIE